MEIPTLAGHELPSVTTEQMIEVDRAMMEDYRVELIQMMENAGRNLAHLARMRFLNGHPAGKAIAVLAGSGGNGGGALVCARRLSNWGANVGELFLANISVPPALYAAPALRLKVGAIFARSEIIRLSQEDKKPVHHSE